MKDINRIQTILENHTPSNHHHAAVMLPLMYDEHNNLSLLFQVRSTTLRSQPGEICFPGGRMDKEDISPEYTAVRELCEELGVTAQDVSVLSALEPRMSPRRGAVYPFVCHLLHPEKLSPNQDEVSSIFTIPLDFLLENKHHEYQSALRLSFAEDFPVKQIANSAAYTNQSFTRTEYVFQYKEHTVWGLTAQILVDFIDILKKNSV
ncbi:NUDIX hydrolase [Alkalicoccobacillus porphyridii]|uniref:CoA pyrophosphatase n=1 Tax=Alkalicoccobacillus porphyridii TaxID=2597270 RepID=A0A553ZW45_9BACI|nr:CoA pyrophosphatase [Alkalicoccobacillus porphyridii]TSB45653.1 CoA pyrophosphatase [Alkalicoccobacillus porphyridii]